MSMTGWDAIGVGTGTLVPAVVFEPICNMAGIVMHREAVEKHRSIRLSLAQYFMSRLPRIILSGDIFDRFGGIIPTATIFGAVS